ncbi:outer membrane protein [Ahrensia sp. R2A130]|uniref:outer membrane protein n=1 Tax=Ahrensia sp. R2A130 TaxID=744979 RepID=UPI0001E0B525|nr:outer membrane beta-barrel protein [Ahrensia sp. R2A130]EFL87785.1 putative porin opacity type [Ahrensia sp. R2A130]
MTTVLSHIARRLVLCTTAAALATSLSASLSASAFAADMLEQEAMPQTVVEFGTGWYIRGEISLNHNGSLFLSDRSEPIPATGTFERTTTDVDNVFGGTLAVGQRLTNNVRLDASYAYLGSGTTEREGRAQPLRSPCSPADARRVNTTTGVEFIDTAHTIENCNESSFNEYSLQHFGVNAFWDFDTSFYGFRPFVGAGLGVIRNSFNSRAGDVTCSPRPEERCAPTDGGQLPSDSDGFGAEYTQQGLRDNGVSYHLATSLTAGVSVPINKYMHFDTSYQWTHMMEDAMWGGSTLVNSTDTPTDFHSVKVGLRFDIF